MELKSCSFTSKELHVACEPHVAGPCHRPMRQSSFIYAEGYLINKGHGMRNTEEIMTIIYPENTMQKSTASYYKSMTSSDMLNDISSSKDDPLLKLLPPS